MITKEDFEKVISGLKGKLDETTTALVSEELLETVGAFNSGYDDYLKVKEENEKLKNEKEELLKINGRLYQKIGFDRDEENEKESEKIVNEDEEIDIDDIINEKGELI